MDSDRNARVVLPWFVDSGACHSVRVLCDVSHELDDTEAALDGALAELEDAQEELASVLVAEEIDFDNGLVVSEVAQVSYNVEGKVKNVSDESMPRVAIVVAFYQEDGSLAGVRYHELSNLYPGETLEWRVYSPSLWDYEFTGGGRFDVYAVGNK